MTNHKKNQMDRLAKFRQDITSLEVSVEVAERSENVKLAIMLRKHLHSLKNEVAMISNENSEIRVIRPHHGR